ncbi:MAG: hypothetical protein KGI50_07495, partial [Patescibacteria group bacterium]|nr:hypothetical protein [Patescibacteria group bacterium]
MLGMFKKKKFVSLIAALCMFGASLPAARASAYGALSLTDSYKATYTASSGIFTCAASPTDFWQFFGSSTKTIRILKIYYENMNTSSASVYFDNIYLIRRSTANSGASVSDTVVPLDSNNPAATGSPGHYTANPTVGTTAGTI